MSCPGCDRLVDFAPLVRQIAICPHCLASVVIEDGHIRRALGSDTTVLTQDELRKLRGVRKQYRGAA